MTKISPCMGCQERTTGERSTDCHGTCERYLAFRDDRIAEERRRREFYRVRGVLQEGRQRRGRIPYSTIHGTFKQQKQ